MSVLCSFSLEQKQRISLYGGPINILRVRFVLFLPYTTHGTIRKMRSHNSRPRLLPVDIFQTLHNLNKPYILSDRAKARNCETTRQPGAGKGANDWAVNWDNTPAKCQRQLGHEADFMRLEGSSVLITLGLTNELTHSGGPWRGSCRVVRWHHLA